MTIDSWNSADPYEYFMGRWGTIIASKFLDWLGAPGEKSWLDLGCGTGVLSEAVLKFCSPSELTCVDPSEVFLAQAKSRIQGAGNFSLGKAGSIPMDRNSVDVVVSGLALNFFPSLKEALSEMQRVAKQGGIISAYVWDYAARMDMLRYFWDAVIGLDPGSHHLDEGVRFPICNPTILKASFEHFGFTNVETASLDIITHFESFEDYWKPFLGGQGPAPGYLMSLPNEMRNKLRTNVQNVLPTASDGSITMTGRAFAVKCRVKK